MVGGISCWLVRLDAIRLHDNIIVCASTGDLIFVQWLVRLIFTLGGLHLMEGRKGERKGSGGGGEGGIGEKGRKGERKGSGRGKERGERERGEGIG